MPHATCSRLMTLCVVSSRESAITHWLHRASTSPLVLCRYMSFFTMVLVCDCLSNNWFTTRETSGIFCHWNNPNIVEYPLGLCLMQWSDALYIAAHRYSIILRLLLTICRNRQLEATLVDNLHSEPIEAYSRCAIMCTVWESIPTPFKCCNGTTCCAAPCSLAYYMACHGRSICAVKSCVHSCSETLRKIESKFAGISVPWITRIRLVCDKRSVRSAPWSLAQSQPIQESFFQIMAAHF